MFNLHVPSSPKYVHVGHTRYVNIYRYSFSSYECLGILAGEKQSLNRGYDYVAVLKWFAERADRIILLFDAHKVDISDEFKQAIEAIKAHDDKIR